MNGVLGTMTTRRGLLLLVACFLLGWGAGAVDGKMLLAAKTLLAETYINKFNAMSGANIDEYLYYVVSDDVSVLHQIAGQASGVNRIEATSLPTVFNTYIAAAARHEMLVHLRSLPSVTAVFTVPFMCH